MNDVQSHLHVLTYAITYLGELLVHVQNFTRQVNPSQHFGKCAQLSFCK